MANVLTLQKLIDGPRNAVFKCDVAMDGVSGELVNQMVVQVNQLSSMLPGPNVIPKRVRVDILDWDVQNGLAVSLFWEGAGRAALWRMVGRSMEKAFHIGGLQNNADNPTGNIVLDTTIQLAGAPLFGTFKIHCVKQS